MGRPPLDLRKTAADRRRALMERSRKVPLRRLLPNLITLLALCAGLTAIRMAIDARFEIAVGAIVLAAVLDGLDGRLARALKATSRFGAELDSLADFVNFGVAPAIVLYVWAFAAMPSLGWVAALIFALCTAFRLARFNVALDEPEPPIWQGGFFRGIPAPAAAITALLPFYIAGLGVPKELVSGPASFILALFIAALMVSRLPAFSGKMLGQSVARDQIVPLFIAAVLLAAMLATYPYLTLTTLSLGYLASLPLAYRRYQALRMAEPNSD